MEHHGGNIEELAEILSCRENDIIDFSANINPSGFPPWLRDEISKETAALSRYPDIRQKQFTKAVSRHTGVPETMIAGGNGAGELLDLIPRIIQPDSVILPAPSFGEYHAVCRGLPVEHLLLPEKDNFTLNVQQFRRKLADTKGKKLTFIGQPNNPTGILTPENDIMALVRDHPGTFFCIDESFADFVSEYVSPSAMGRSMPGNIIIVRSMTKFYALPGLRIGYCIAHPEIITRLKELQPPWSVNTLALAAGTRAVQDSAFQTKAADKTRGLRRLLLTGLRSFSWLKVFPSSANFFLLKITHSTLRPEELYSFLQKKKIIVRHADSFYGLNNYFFRIGVQSRQKNDLLVEALQEFSRISGLSSGAFPSTGKEKKKTAALMIQGTSSDAGKSIITAGICRILRNEGIRVAPFKAQNMALNSAVTPNGGEMGRAQALQAKAAGILPDVRMNPVLLKPTGERGSEMILSGKPAGFITAANWRTMKEKARVAAETSFDSLAEDYDVLLVEGAGSPGEVNLKEDDIVNMAMARYAEAPVLIVGDIDRGGVYASFIGTMEVFEEWERDLVQGFIVNKFRGERSLLESAHTYVAYRTGKPVIGVIPYFTGITLPQEDSLSFKQQLQEKKSLSSDADILIGVLDLPSISNFTDFDPFLQEKKVKITFITEPGEVIPELDALIIPGSKNVVKDLQFLKKSGIAPAVIHLHKTRNIPVIGICGGFQMLGRTIEDTGNIESEVSFSEGLGLLDIKTTFSSRKRLRKGTYLHIPSGLTVSGYEIHYGISRLIHGNIIMGSRENLMGASSENGGLVWGTYLHGIFDNDTFRKWFLLNLSEKEGLSGSTSFSSYSVDGELDKLADLIASNITMDYIHSLLGL